ncbi:MAG: ABC transporter substrate-binding protein [Hydrogenophaga sp.]|nr:ABC transporter substrate-binding protein [Polaromonas sp.]MDP3168523.1 ABC transporter substrate-binding protein [Hydrogenophaga sp.]
MKRALLTPLLLAASMHLFAGDKGVTPTEIRLGASAVLSGPLGAQTLQYGVGSRLYFDAVNAEGGVHGRKISYTTLDDGFDVKRAVENTRKLIEEESVFMIFNSTGTAQTGAILPLLAESRTIAFGPVTGASAFREKVNPYLFHVRASYANEARRILSQLKQTGITRIAVFYQDDGLGKTLQAELRLAASAENISFVAEIKGDPAKPDFKAAATATGQAQPQAVIVATAGATFTSYVRAVLQTGAKPGFYGFSVASLDVINRELKEQARGIILTQIMPSLRNTTIPVVAEYLKLLREKSPGAAPSASQFEGFVHAKLLVEGLRRAGRPLSTESFIKAMESAGEISFGRFVAKYSPQSHNGSSYVEMAIIDNEGQLRY